MHSHPLYDDDALVADLTRVHVEAGRTVFQLWQVGGSEEAHSAWVLDQVAPPHRARVLSLGCGVGGMEAYWHALRPDMTFTLVNRSASQLDACRCPGVRLVGDAQDYRLIEGQPKHDVAVLAYMLGHVDPLVTLRRALEATQGTVVVLDVFDTRPAFTRFLHYDAPTSHLMRKLGFYRISPPMWQAIDLRGSGIDGEEARASEEAIHEEVCQSMPGMWMRHG